MRTELKSTNELLRHFDPLLLSFANSAPRDPMFFIRILKSLVRLDSVIYVITPSLISNTQNAIIVLIKLLSIELNVSHWRQVGAKRVYICKCPPGVI